MTSSELEREARALAQHLAQGCTQKYGLGSMTPAIYDTAWVSMISKTVDGNPRWLFPECFQFLLDTQLLDGDWESYASNDDGILNTMAALLALKRHGSAPYSTDELPFDFESRMSDAVTCLQSKLQQWDVEASVHVGFEVVIPALLLLLEEENVLFDFPGRQSLMRLNRKKLEKFDPRIMYGSTETTLLHSLEAFIGKIDFDRVGHHTRFGSMMASPSSTAAYLMNSSSWDDEAETYIGTTVMYGEGKGTGGVPSAFPSTNFELTWVSDGPIYEPE